ncbi:MAG: lysine--tRNA ligase [Herpetosiphonaceae bacterium]|nr:MAG: lysine--tRNA ligase [Herpetosiphonaceae bacterium]
MDLNEFQLQRRTKLERLRSAGIDPFPAHVEPRTHTLAALLERFAELAASEAEVRTHGRIRLRRVMGKSSFAHIEDESGRVQIFLSRRDIGEENYDRFVETSDLGDIISVTGHLFHTKTGEPTIFVHSWTMLAKAISPLPEKYHGLEDIEARLRQRYVDLIANEEPRRVFRLRAALIKAIRDFLDDRGFLEVETPVLHPVYGGAAARPFITHHNQLHQDLYLRIALELYLKRLIVGGYERVYEIGRNFRNEGVDRFHNPEFTMLELYQAYADYEDMMELFETMLAFVAERLYNSTSIEYQGQIIDLTPPWPRITMRDAILERTGIDIREARTLEALNDAVRSRGLRLDRKPTWAKQVDELFSEYVEPHLIQPTFIIDYPRELSPLAKARPDDPDFVERFEAFIIGAEMANAFSELNDPFEQEQRFLDQLQAAAAGDEEAMQMDVDFLNALTYGMPPTGGLGSGIDRLTMLFTNQTTIREVILFPHLRQSHDA